MTTVCNRTFKPNLSVKRSLFLFSVVLLIFILFTEQNANAAPVINTTQSHINTSGDPETGTVWNTSMTTSCTGNITVEYSVSGLGDPTLQYRINGGGWNNLITTPTTINAGTSANVEFQLVVTNLLNSESASFNLLVFEALTVTYTYENVSCADQDNGSIDVTASCGEGSTYTYTWTGPESYTSTDEDITGLAPGDYFLTVKTDEGESETLGPITITEPASLSFSLDGQIWSCASCNGRITVTVNGGTAPYDITGGITGTDVSSPYEATGLCAGDYIVSVSDANGCAATDQTRAISLDNVAPTCIFPDNYLLQSSSFGMLTMVPETIANPVPYIYNDGGTHTFGYANDTVAFNDINIANFDDVQFKLDVTQSNVNTWNSNDLIRVEVSTNGGLNWSPIFTDFCSWNATNEPSQAGPCDGKTTSLATSWVDIPDLSGTTFSIRLICITEAPDRTYTVNSFFVRANDTRSAISPSVAGNASCSDNYSTLTTIPPIDGEITWLCNESTNLEFYFTRTWQSTDDCGLSTTGAQRISVGTNPTLADPRDTIFDFCHNENVTISFPASSDNCDSVLQIDYVVRAQGQTISSGGNLSSVGSVQFTNIFESNEATDAVYVITWTATDDAGFSTTQDQRVTILRPITASIISPNQDFCSGQNVSFTITPVGGTGSYVLPLVPGDALGESVSIVPNGTISGNTFTTSNLTMANPNIQVIITDTHVDGAGGVIGGCSSTFTFDGSTGVDYHVHENITTNPLQRD